MRSAVSAVDVSIGGTVCPAPPSAPSSTISAQTVRSAMRTDAQIAGGHVDHGGLGGEETPPSCRG